MAATVHMWLVRMWSVGSVTKKNEVAPVTSNY